MDVALSTSQTRKVLKPYLLMKVKTSDGGTETFEVSPTFAPISQRLATDPPPPFPSICFQVTLEQFHKFRYAVSRSLNEVLKIEKNDQLQRLKSS